MLWNYSDRRILRNVYAIDDINHVNVTCVLRTSTQNCKDGTRSADKQTKAKSSRSFNNLTCSTKNHYKFNIKMKEIHIYKEQNLKFLKRESKKCKKIRIINKKKSQYFQKIPLNRSNTTHQPEYAEKSQFCISY